MLSVEKKLVSCLEEGREPTLSGLGGVEEIITNYEYFATSSFVAELADLFFAEYDMLSFGQRAVIDDFVIMAADSLSDEIQTKEFVEVIDKYDLPEKLEDSICKSFLKLAQDLEKPDMTRAFALDEVLRLACKKESRRFLLFAFLLDVSSTESPILIRYISKILGIANSYWPTDDALASLNIFFEVDEARSESAYEIAMFYLRKGFDALNNDSAKDNFSTALMWFRESSKHAEVRLDAELYEICLAILVEFSFDDLRNESVTNAASRLQEVAFLYEAWVEGDETICWLGARRTEVVNWVLLAKSMEGLACALKEPSWLEAKIVIEKYLLATYTASRTFFQQTSSGVESIIRPCVEASLIKEKGQLHHLRQWLTSIEPSEYKDTAEKLIAKLDRRLEENFVNPIEATHFDHKGVAFLMAENVPSVLREAYSLAVSLTAENTSPIFEEVLSTCDNELRKNIDYRTDRVRSVFLPVLAFTLRFLESRMDHTKGYHSSLKYLYEMDPLPSEDDLQRDYYDFMYGVLPVSSLEVSNVGGGRSDVLFQTKGIKFVAELKKEESDCSFSGLQKQYAAQATEYQNTNVTLGILLVLDLTLKNSGAGHFRDLVKVTNVHRFGDDCPRDLVIIKVPGRRKTPSGLK